MGRVAPAIVLEEQEKEQLEQWRRRRKTANALHCRAGIVLDCARGLSGAAIAERHGVTEQTVTKWRHRFLVERLAGLSDAPRPGQPRHHGDERVQKVIDATVNRRPRRATHWSVRSLAEELGYPPRLYSPGMALVWTEAPFVEKLQAVE